MGCLYQRRVCRTCKGGSLKACEAAGHRIVTLPIWWIKYRQNGKSVSESSGSEKKTDAKDLLARRVGDIKSGRPVAAKAERVTFEEAAKDLVNDYKTNGKKTLDDAERRIEKHLRPFFGRHRLLAITTADVRAYVAKRLDDTFIVRKARTTEGPDGIKRELPEQRRPVSKAEINRELTLLKRMFSLAIQAGKIFHKPHVEMLREDNVREGFFEHHEYRSVLKHLPEDVRPIVTFAYLTGWRIASEVLPLEWRQVDRDAGEVRLNAGTTKNRDGRVIYFSPELRRLFDERWVVREQLLAKGTICPHVFHRTGKPIKSIRIAWQTACRAAGCPGRIPHDLRRTAARNMVRNGLSEQVAMKITGHKTRSVFARYNVTSDGDLRAAAQKLDGYTSVTLPATSGRRPKRQAQIS